jgi:polyisoprenoid-binding protein YceI
MITTSSFRTTLILGLVCACAASSAQTAYKILPPSRIEVSGTSTLSNWSVRSEELSGEMSLSAPAKDVSSSATVPGTIAEATVRLQVSTIKSEKGETMDNKMYNALKKDSHPTITFSLKRPLQLSGKDTIAAEGDVTLAGVTKPMIFDLHMDAPNNAFHFHGKKSLKLSDFQIEPPTAMFGQIETGDDIVVEVDVLFGK